MSYKNTDNISIVIPTYNRTESLKRLLHSITHQTLLPSEIIISSVDNDSKKRVLEIIKNINISTKVLFSEASVCKQRNVGIKTSKCKYILLCDDDIELPKNYLERLYLHLEKHQNINIATGEEHQLTSTGTWEKIEQKMSGIKLIFNYLFGLPIWFDLKSSDYSTTLIMKPFIDFYIKKGNHIGKSGWPIISDFSYPVMETSIYGLGCSMSRSEVLKQNLFDENIGQYGFGDNYDVGLRINGFKKKIHVLRDLHFKHYKSAENRLSPTTSYYLRTKTLFSFLKKLEFFTFKNRLFFLWSLIGNGLLFFISGRFGYFYANLKVFKLALFNLLGSKKIYH